ncbi:MAG: hypothetical protein QM657_06795 [Lacrimispora sp.]|uniref:hypothetical protein n=1 Tax=Lacrimispora sp. TaxID=2719234 RepID=UPI0039E48076
MKAMKKISYILCLSLFVTLAAAQAAYAGDDGKVSSLEDRITPEGKDAVITQIINAKTNASGEVSFPMWKKTEVESVTATSGTLASDHIEERTDGDQVYHLAVFNEKEAEVSFQVVLRGEGFYEGEEADLGDTYPGNAMTFSFKTKNNTPLTIDSYIMKIAVPKEKELLSIVDYSDKKPYTITSEDGYTFGGYDFGEVAPGKESKLAINVFVRKSSSAIFLWVIIAVLSAGYMYRNLDLLKKPVKK